MSVELLPSTSSRLLLRATFDRLSPRQVFDHFTQPALLQRWWAPQAEVDGRLGGRYHLIWPAPGWHLRGAFTAYEPGGRLAFTWAWDHEPQLPTRQVELSLAPHGEAGAVLTLSHGHYGEGEVEAADRASHWEGWHHFLGQLAGLDPLPSQQ